MTANDDIGHPEHRHGVFDRCRHTSGVGAIRRHDIPRVSDHEQFARFLLRQQFWYYAAIGTRDEQRAWMLRGGQVFEQVRPLRKCFFLKLLKTFNERFHGISLLQVVKLGNIQLVQPRPITLYSRTRVSPWESL